MPWKQVQDMGLVIGNNCGYTWQNTTCVYSGGACVPPKGSDPTVDMCAYMMCADPAECPQQYGAGWVCGVYWFDPNGEGGTQTTPSGFGATNIKCDAEQRSLSVVSILAAAIACIARALSQ